MSPRWNEGLAGAALQIAQTNGSPLWVAAGPGTGKTFSLMRRLARLLEVEGVHPERILVCTFTRTAAGDLARAVATLGIAGAEEVEAQTVHALCFSMLAQEAVLRATGRTPRPLLQSEERFLLEDLRQAGLGGIRDCGKQLRAFSAAWARLQHEQPGWPASADDRRFQAALQAWLLFHRAMLIGELIPEGLKYLRLNPLAPHRTAFDHILVDEYQDLNRAEQQLIELISGGSLVVIGDEDQSIYSFKHAHPEGIVEFPGAHPETEQAQLDECRRCPRKVVAMANALIVNNASRSNRALRPFPGNPEGEIFSVQWRDMQGEAQGLARFIKARIDAGAIQPGEVLALAPRREFGYLLRDQLVALGVPAHSFFSEELLDGDPKDDDVCQAQKALALLTLLADREDRVALRCWCGFGSNSLRALPWAALKAHCEQSGESPWAALEKLEAGTLAIARTGPLVERFTVLKVELARLGALTGAALFDAIFPPAENWAEAFAPAKEHLEEGRGGPRELSGLIRRHITQPELPTDVDFVRVMSLHKSKGLTAKMVLIVGALEGLMPSIDHRALPAEQRRSLEEQRRLFYVAVTRSRETLLFSTVTRLPAQEAYRMRARVGPNAQTIASRFIAELGPECPAAITGAEFLRLAVEEG